MGFLGRFPGLGVLVRLYPLFSAPATTKYDSANRQSGVTSIAAVVYQGEPTGLHLDLGH